jgi:tetratricopeptide (TPR) repeat protein
MATLTAQLGRMHFFRGDHDAALDRVDEALAIAESLSLPEILSEALNTKSLILSARGRPEEGLALLTHALKIALDNDVPTAVFRAYNNLDVSMSERDRLDDVLEFDLQGLDLARKVGDRFWEWTFLSNLGAQRWWTGNWDEALVRLAEIPDPEEVLEARFLRDRFAAIHLFIELGRGNLTEAEQWLSKVENMRDSSDVQDRSAYFLFLGELREAQDRHVEAMRAFEEALLGVRLPHLAAREAIVHALQSALAIPDLEAARDLLGRLEDAKPGEIGPYLHAQAQRLRARFQLASGQNGQVEVGFKAAIGAFGELGLPFWLAVTLLEYGEWLVQLDRANDAGPILREAREIFERLKAALWLDRIGRAESGYLERTAVS